MNSKNMKRRVFVPAAKPLIYKRPTCSACGFSPFLTKKPTERRESGHTLGQQGSDIAAETSGVISNMVDTWSDRVSAYCDNPVISAYTSAVISVAKGINRIGRGYRLDVFRANLLYNLKVRAGIATRTQVLNADRERISLLNSRRPRPTASSTRAIYPARRRACSFTGRARRDTFGDGAFAAE